MTYFKDIFSNRDKVIADREAISKSVTNYIKQESGLIEYGQLERYFYFPYKESAWCRIHEDILKVWDEEPLPNHVHKNLTYFDCSHIINELHKIINDSKNEKAIKLSKMTLDIFCRYQELLLFKEKRIESIFLILNIVNAIVTPILLWYVFLLR